MKNSLLLAACTLGLFCGRAFAQTASQLYTEGVQTYEAGNVAVAKQKLQLALEIDRNFKPASALLTKITLEERQASAQTNVVSVESLRRTIVPVDFNNTTLQVAVEILRQRISEKSGGKLEVNFVLQLPSDLANKRVNLHLEHAPATEVFRYLGSVAGVTFKIEQYAVTITPADVPAAPVPSAKP